MSGCYMLGIVFSISPLPLVEKDILYFFRAIFYA